jgi:uncharacterized protein YcbX
MYNLPMANLRSLWLYPVKSMGGEEVEAMNVVSNGIWGDRAYAFVDEPGNQVATAKRTREWADLLKYRARFLAPPQVDGPVPDVEITTPDGTVLASNEASFRERLATAVNRTAAFTSSVPAGLMVQFAAGTLGGKFAAATELPIAGAAPGKFVDYSAVHLVTTSSLKRLGELYPQGSFAVERFRPNLVVETAEPGFVENSWVGRMLAVGDEVLLRVTIPCPRCVMPTLPRLTLPLDSGILRTASEHNRQDLGDFGRLPCVGVYADVVKTGRIRRGDSLRVAD